MLKALARSRSAWRRTRHTSATQ